MTIIWRLFLNRWLFLPNVKWSSTIFPGASACSRATAVRVWNKQRNGDDFGLCTKPKHNVVMHEECEKMKQGFSSLLKWFLTGQKEVVLCVCLSLAMLTFTLCPRIGRQRPPCTNKIRRRRRRAWGRTEMLYQVQILAFIVVGSTSLLMERLKLWFWFVYFSRE